MNAAPSDAARIVLRDDLDALIEQLQRRGYRTRGPIVRDGAVVHGPLGRIEDLPVGFRDQQSPGHYSLRCKGGAELFGWAVGPHSMKGEYFPPQSSAWTATLRHGALSMHPQRTASEAPLAFVGARPCEVAAEHVLAHVLVEGEYQDTTYGSRRLGAVVVVAECGRPSGTCFCSPMGAGPGSEGRFDLALTELPIRPGEGSYRYLVRAGTETGRDLLAALGGSMPASADWDARARVLADAIRQMEARFSSAGLSALLEENIEHPEWDRLGERCLGCGNCTMVCPTCFCTTVEDRTDLAGTLERTRRWSSCFEVAHSFLHGGAVRTTIASRYRQWATHKLSTWHQQFGSSGCVGCGRCITWCPVGIDLTAVVSNIRSDPVGGRS